MSDVLTHHPARTADDDEITLSQLLAEMEDVRRQIDADQADIDKLRQEGRTLKEETRVLKEQTRVILANIKSMVQPC